MLSVCVFCVFVLSVSTLCVCVCFVSVLFVCVCECVRFLFFSVELIHGGFSFYI